MTLLEEYVDTLKVACNYFTIQPSRWDGRFLPRKHKGNQQQRTPHS